MAYKKDEIEKQSINAIEKNSLVFIDDIFAFVPFSCATFYNHKLEKLDSIKEAINKNKIDTKRKLRRQWLESKSAILQIALYKLICTNAEYERLIQQKIDHTSGGDKISLPYDVKIESRENINPK